MSVKMNEHIRRRDHWSNFLSFSCQFHVGGCNVDKVRSFAHLGHIINSELSDPEDILHNVVLLLCK